MSKPSLEQQRIASLEHALEVAMYWLLRAHDSHGAYAVAQESIGTFLSNHGIDTGPKAATVRRQSPQYYHHELEKAVKRATK